METIDEWGSQQFLNKLRCCIGGGSEIDQVDWYSTFYKVV